MPDTRWPILAGALALCAGCAQVPPPAAPVAPAALTIEVAATGADAWRATIVAPAPVQRLGFTRRSALVRAERWQVTTPGYRIVREGEMEALVLDAGAAAQRTVELAFATDTAQLPKDYELFHRFSDGSVVLYTGHLALALPGPDAAPPRFRFVPRAGEQVVVDGGVARAAIEWQDPGTDGTYAYFGRLQPRESAALVAVLDPALPAWLGRRLDEMLPKLFADYTALTGRALATRPMVFFSFEASRTPGQHSWKGGALPGLIQLHMADDPAAPEDPERLAEFVGFLAHEAAHLWNGQLYRARGPDDSWMHEGSADAFAWRVLRRQGLIDDAGLEARQLAALNDCLDGLGADPLGAAERGGDFGLVYRCGAMLAWFSEQAVARAEPRADLFGLWRALFDSAAADGGVYDEARYLDAMRQAGAADAARRFVDDFAHAAMPDRRERTLREFAAVGLPLRADDALAPAARRERLGRRAVLRVMEADCDGWYSLEGTARGVVILGAPRCRTLQQRIEVTRVEGVPLADGSAAYAAVVRACRPGGTVALDAGPGSPPVTVPCTKAVVPNPAWIAVAR